MDGLPVPQRYGAILAIAFGITVSVLDGTIANVALPTIASDFNVSPAVSVWVVNAYQLAIIVSLLSFSSLGDIIGYRKIYLFGLTLFSITSFACALSHSLLMLVIARIFQGFGAAAITSVNTALVRLIYPQCYLGRGMGINALVVAVSAAAGPTVAAGILSIGEWPWLFAINVPIGIIAIFLSSRFLPYNKKSTARKFDLSSGIMNGITFGLLIFIIEGFAHGLNISFMITCFIVMSVTAYFYVRRQLSRPYPIFPVDLLKIPIFRRSVGTSVCSFLAQMLAMVSLPFFLQHIIGHDDVTTGLLLTPWPIATMIAAPLAGRLMERIHAGILGGAGLFVFAAGLFLLAFLPQDVTNGGIVWRMMMCGFGFGLFQSPNNSVIISSAPPARSGGASGMLGTARLLGQTSGAALVALMFNLFAGQGTHFSLLLAGIFAVIAAIVSCLRISLPLPETLRKKPDMSSNNRN